MELHPVPGDLVFPPHHGAPEPLLGVGHEAQGQLLRDQTFHQPLRSGKSFLRPPGPRFDCAWARWSVPASRGAPSRARRRGRQCCSRASHTGRQYCAVDSMTTSSTSCSTSQSARPRRSAGVVPTFWRSKRKSPSTSRRPPRPPASSCARQFPRSGTASVSPWESGERASSYQSGSRAVVGALWHSTTPDYSVNHARSGSNSCSASTAPLAHFDLAALGAILTR